jgi:hypothetical protein
MRRKTVSEFIERLMMTNTGRREQQEFMPPLSFKITEDNPQDQVYTYRLVYKMEVMFRQNVTCTEEDKPRALENAKKQIARALYKDFEDELIKMEEALYNQDAHTMRTHLDNLLKLIWC